tara:strand:- start:124 stop:333 length:210 start_codon:yes stop_codon:yes gene_type:complete
MKVGDYVQFCPGVRGAKGFIIRQEPKALYYKDSTTGEIGFCFVVRYILPGGRVVENLAPPEYLKLLSEA